MDAGAAPGGPHKTKLFKKCAASATRLRNVQRRGQSDTKCQTKIHSATKTRRNTDPFKKCAASGPNRYEMSNEDTQRNKDCDWCS